MNLVYGLITGLLFGVFLQRAQVVRYSKQIGALRLLDMTIVKFMLSNIFVAMVGLYALKDFGLIHFHLKTTALGAIIIGGTLFGIGWGILGYCPGTALGAIGEGRIDALWGILGMLVGAGIYAEIYPWIKTYIIPLGNYGKITLPQLLGINHWIVIIIFGICCLGLFYWFEKNDL
ncbi:hypothetical protein SAMN04488516_102202 [Desulfonauticus submarinus]|uniref:Uncharacterized protein n=1 Tax=Desulfonauticus submarinus TaxID=206665 RepID=A0A1H0BK87_9BACT|nr:DUF6691 family protein [Desulfonauticus submarinus]SDN46060.1 hypothetical protein SAMN04488516_102202 [Desulfonauticus submarinus]